MWRECSQWPLYAQWVYALGNSLVPCYAVNSHTFPISKQTTWLKRKSWKLEEAQMRWWVPGSGGENQRAKPAKSDPPEGAATRPGVEHPQEWARERWHLLAEGRTHPPLPTTLISLTWRSFRLTSSCPWVVDGTMPLLAFPAKLTYQCAWSRTWNTSAPSRCLPVRACRKAVAYAHWTCFVHQSLGVSAHTNLHIWELPGV